MTKKDLVAGVAKKAGVSEKVAGKVMDAVVDAIVAAAMKDGVRVNGLGTFKVQKRAARTAKNPKTGAVVKVPAKKVVVFKATKALRSL